MGGSDDPSNLVEVTIEEHANLHKQLWEELGHWQDKVAWLALSNQITSPEILKIIRNKISETLKQTYKNGYEPWNKGKRDIYSKEQKENLRIAGLKQMHNMTEDEKIQHSIKSGKGARWYTNGSEEKWIRPNQDIPEGWKVGRKKITEETRQKMSFSHLGQIPWNKDKGKTI